MERALNRNRSDKEATKTLDPALSGKGADDSKATEIVPKPTKRKNLHCSHFCRSLPRLEYETDPRIETEIYYYY